MSKANTQKIGDYCESTEVKLRRLQQYLNQQSERLLRQRLELNLNQAQVLMYIGDARVSTQRDLAERMMVTPAAVSRLVDSLVERGVVERRVSAVSRREHELALTENGIGLTSDAMRLMDAQFATVFEGLSPADRKAFASSLEHLIKITKA